MRNDRCKFAWDGHRPHAVIPECARDKDFVCAACIGLKVCFVNIPIWQAMEGPILQHLAVAITMIYIISKILDETSIHNWLLLFEAMIQPVLIKRQYFFNPHPID
ncbi:hypothetical protein D4A92_17790 [Rhizobium rosettiformans]|uniref:Uncharacterized protein n=1 Tax=Rhizobium rosettiformans TaxID=1368430 RepID=A0ABX7EXX9_9HYPH|nr:hypothetical protein D4A92_17790 [Rhizobium rosettiformans]